MDQQTLYAKSKEKQAELTPAEIWERLARKYQKNKEESERERQVQVLERQNEVESPGTQSNTIRRPAASVEQSQILASWNPHDHNTEDRFLDFRTALGKWLEFEFRLAFAEGWHERAIRHSETYRFEVLDQSTTEERRISDLDVRRRAAARATRIAHGNHDVLIEAIAADLAKHADTLQELKEARETKIASLKKDVGSLRSNLAKIEHNLARRHDIPSDRPLVPLLSRETLSELQEQTVRLNLPERVSELEKLRLDLAREHNAPTRNEIEVSGLVAQVNVARADFRAREARLDNFEASVHLTSYEVSEERWSLAALDKHIARRREDTKIIPDRAAHLNWRSLARLNYSAVGREQAAADVKHLMFIRSEIVRQIEERRAPLVADRDSSREMLDVLENTYASEQRSRSQNGLAMPEPRYERYQINALEASAEILRDSNLLRDVHEWEKHVARNDSDINWEGRAIAREIMAGIAVEETKERLQHFLDSKKVASLHLGNHQTGTLRHVEARSLTDYLARAILETRDQRNHRLIVKSGAHEHHVRLVKDFDKATNYHEVAREFASEVTNRGPQFTDKEKINLEIYAERHNDGAERTRYLELARRDSHSEHEVAISRSR